MASAIARPPVPVKSHHPDRRLTALVWNSGGLSSARWAELQLWLLHQQTLDLVLLPETRWSFTSEWMTDNWYIIHSGLHKSSGIMIMVSKRLKPVGHIAWQSHVDGRLLHVRLHGDGNTGNRNIDIVGVYQAHAGSNVKGEQSNIREHTWKAMDDLIAALPRRNKLLIAGDFNTTLPVIPHVCLVSSLRWNGAAVSNQLTDDSHAFAQTLAQHGLVGLNCWQPNASPTFIGLQHQARVDFVLTRTPFADAQAKQPVALFDFPMLPDTGFHVPMLVTLPTRWKALPSVHRPHLFTMKQRLHCRQLRSAHDASWSTLHSDIAQALPSIQTRNVDVIDSVHTSVAQHFDSHWMQQPDHVTARTPNATVADTGPQSSPEPGVSGLTMSFVKHKWELWHQFKKFQPCSQLTVFRCWMQITQFAKIKRSQAKLVKQAKQQKFDAVLQEADEAARHYDLWGLRRLIGRITPKNRRTRIQLRTSTGGLADPVTSHEMMYRFVQETWNPMRLSHPDSLRLKPWHCAPGVPFTKDQLRQALSQLPANKAVAYCFAMPQHWRDGWMVLCPNRARKLTDVPICGHWPWQNHVGRPSQAF